MERIKKDIHTHTIYSRGVGHYGHHAISTMMENAESAYQKGLSVLGISDHGPSHKLYGINSRDWQSILDDKKRVNEYYNPKGLTVILGMEANLTGWDGEVDIPEDWLKDMDYVLMGYHYAAMPSDPMSGVEMFIMNPMSKFLKLGRLRTIEKNTIAFIKAVERYPLFGITHPGDKIEIDVRELAKACKKHKVKLEVNAAHCKLTSEDLISLGNDFSDYFVGSDAHNAMRVGEVDKAIRICESGGVNVEDIWNFKE